MRTRLAWTLFALTCVCAVVQVTLLARRSTPLFSTVHVGDGFPLVTMAAVAGAGIGALIVSRYPHHRIGWLLVVGQFGTAFGVAAQAYGRSGLSGELASAPGAHLALWLANQTGAVFAIAILAAVFLLAPDGHLLSPRWKWAMWVSVLGLVLTWAAWASVRPRDLDASGRPETSAVLRDVLATVGAFAVLAGLVAAAVSLVIRLRRATGERRQQLLLFTVSAAGLGLGTVIGIAGGMLGAPNWLVILPLMLAYLSVPILTGVAILRFHLYDIDVIISRAIVLTVLSGFVAVGYVVLVLVISELVDAPAEGTFWPSVMAMVLVALAVQPLRHWVGQLADRVVYGAQAAPYEALADFSRGLHDSRAADDLLPRVARAVGRSVGARHVVIWTEIPGSAASSYSWPDSTEHVPDLVLPVMDGDDVRGGLAVTMPPGRPLRPAEQQLLRDFTVQLGRAFGNLRLESELAERVDELAEQANELAASRGRLVSAQETGRHRFESAISREVLPHLTGLPEELAAMGAMGAQPGVLDPEPIEAMIARTNAALDSLRTLTRGVFPAQLAHRGLVPALSSYLTRTGAAGMLRTDDAVVEQRFDPRVESAAYFCAVEFLRELDPPEDVLLTEGDGTLSLTVTGHGTATVETGTRHLADRVAAVGGTLRISVLAGLATMFVDVPLTSDAGGVPELQEPAGVER